MQIVYFRRGLQNKRIRAKADTIFGRPSFVTRKPLLLDVENANYGKTLWNSLSLADLFHSCVSAHCVGVNCANYLV